MTITLTPRELQECADNPIALRALADYHDCLATEADAIGEPILAACVTAHETRALELRREADRIEEGY